MNYMITRDGQEYGPYSLGDLQRYVTSGEILLSDMARSDGMTEFLPVSQVIGTIPVPAQPTHISLAPLASQYPDPPNLHWGLVLLFEVLSCGLFAAAWGIVIAVWMRKVDPKSKALFFYFGYALCLGLIFVASFVAAMQQTQSPFNGILNFASLVLLITARFTLRSALEQHFNSAEPMGLQLNGVMTFFFAEIYFQFHLNNINRRKNLDRLGL